jgi:beta-glucanase (GH16 family)
VANRAEGCTPSVTTVSGTHAPETVCSGELLFEDNFNILDTSRWKHEISLAGGGNWEFQWYVNDRQNSFVANGLLNFRTSFTSDIFGETFLTTGRVIIPPGECTLAEWYGCDRQGTPTNIINPIRSARLDTRNSFGFKFGTLEIRAKMPAGDWLWPALWLMPQRSVYGGWPASGEIDLLEQRSNRELYNGNVNVGVNQAGSTMHFGPRPDLNAWQTTHATRNQVPGFDANFHVYRLQWTPTGLTFFVDGNQILNVPVGAGFWARGGFASSGAPNPWLGGTNMAPFDQEFFIIMNLAVGGTNFFADSFVNRNSPKPWLNTSPRAAADFWLGRSAWQPTWNLHTADSQMQIDYVRVWAL